MHDCFGLLEFIVDCPYSLSTITCISQTATVYRIKFDEFKLKLDIKSLNLIQHHIQSKLLFLRNRIFAFSSLNSIPICEAYSESSIAFTYSSPKILPQLKLKPQEETLELKEDEKIANIEDNSHKRLIQSIDVDKFISKRRKNKVEFRHINNASSIESSNLMSSVCMSQCEEQDTISSKCLVTMESNKSLNKDLKSIKKRMIRNPIKSNRSNSIEDVENNTIKSRYKEEIVEYKIDKRNRERSKFNTGENYNGIMISVSGNHYKHINSQDESKNILEENIFEIKKQNKYNFKLPNIRNHGELNTECLLESDFNNEYYLTSASSVVENDKLGPIPINPKIKTIFSKRRSIEFLKLGISENIDPVKENK